jgi:hypothetical protein
MGPNFSIGQISPKIIMGQIFPNVPIKKKDTTQWRLVILAIFDLDSKSHQKRLLG